MYRCRREEKKQAREKKKDPVEEMEPMESPSPTELVLVNPAYPEQLVKIGKNLSPEGSTQLKNLLRKNKDVFAWEPVDMTGVPKRIIKHSLNVSPTDKLVAQKRRIFSKEKKQVITRDVFEWLKARIVRRVKYPTWISNPVLVQKPDGSWRMCIDFKNLNSSCPKDYYPLPEIDSEIEVVMGYPSRATYQRLVDEAFDKQIGRNLEVYVDDMVIKSKAEKDMLADTAETFDNLRRINMKLNPKKCSFENKEDYRWTEGAEKAFQELKKTILNLPTLTTPIPEENLKELCPIGNFALALKNASRRLRRYFETHPITVITDQPIKQILGRAETSGRLAQYAVKLGAYKITYEPRNSIKGQVLADFLNEIPVGSDTLVPIETTYTKEDKKDRQEEWTLFTDGASISKGSGAGLVLISPTKTEYTYALRLTFDSTNNQAEYEAPLAGLRITKKMGVQALSVKVDSKLVASQINGDYVACKENMIRYLTTAKEYIKCFKSFRIKNIPRSQNQKADVLSKLASVAFNHLTKEILVETLDTPSMNYGEINAIVEEEGENWMSPIIRCLEEGIWPEDEREARALRMKINQYVMEGVLFKRSYLMPMLRCVCPLQANYVIREIHMDACSMHMKPRSLVAQAIRQGYYWPTMHRDAREEIHKCDSCQIHAPVPKMPKTLMTSIMEPWPFYQWGMDVLGPLPEVPGKVKYVIVAIDYFTKWIEAKPLARTTGKEVKKIRLGQHRFCTSSGKRPSRKGKPESHGRLKTRLGRERKGWVDELPNVLWSHRTSLKTSNGETPYSLTFGSEAVIPAEVGMPTHRTMMIKVAKDNEEEIRLNLDLLTEKREAAAIREARNEASRVEDLGKLGPKWEGPYLVIEAYGNGSYKLQTMEGREVPRTWHAINLRRCYL
ncbi:reverse transcriptase domain-containing protein [Tanacetum coccineum]